MERAVRLAIEKGDYKLPPSPFRDRAMRWENSINEYEVIKYYPLLAVLDPLFWQALGRALKWHEWTDVTVGNWDEMHLISPQNVLTWKHHALRYFELRMNGGNENKFWEDLINHSN